MENIEIMDNTDNTENKYNQGKIYRIICDDGHYYIGATTQNLNLRFNNHKSLSKTGLNKVYLYINEIGWDNARIELIENYICNNKKELNEHEKIHITQSKGDPECLNFETVNIYKNGKIYKIECSDGHYYIGSTTQKLNHRLNHHKITSKTQNTTAYIHIKNIGWDNVTIKLIENYPCDLKQQLNEKEDYYIMQYKNDPFCLNENRAYVSSEERKENKIQYTANHRQESIERTKKYRAEHHEEILTKEAEYREANRALLNEKQKQYVQNLSDEKKLERKQHAAEYIQQNKEHINEQYKKYVNANREKIQLRKNAWAKKKREENADTNATELEEKQIAKDKKVKERIERDRAIHTCECGGTYQFYQKKRHIDSIKHMTFLENNIII